MCESISALIANAKDQKSAKSQPSLLIAEKDAEGRPVGTGGRTRRRRIDEIVDGAQTGLQIPQK